MRYKQEEPNYKYIANKEKEIFILLERYLSLPVFS